MDQREALRSLYSVVCPHCESVSQADEPLCPYCGADRHGAVLTRGHASFLEVGVDDTAHALLQAASVHLSERSPAESDSREQDMREADIASPFSLLQKNWLAVAAAVAVGACVVLGAYAWVRTASYESRTDVASAAGIVRENFTTFAPAARLDRGRNAGASVQDKTVLVAQERFLGMSRPMNHAESSGFLRHAPLCIAVEGLPSLFETPWCDKPTSIRAALSGANATSVQTSERAAHVSLARRALASHSTSTRGHSFDVNGRLKIKAVRGQSSTQPARRATSNDKTGKGTDTRQRAAAPVEKRAEISYIEKPKSISARLGPTSFVDAAPGTTHEPYFGHGHTARDDPSVTTRGRGEAH